MDEKCSYHIVLFKLSVVMFPRDFKFYYSLHNNILTSRIGDIVQADSAHTIILFINPDFSKRFLGVHSFGLFCCWIPIVLWGWL